MDTTRGTPPRYSSLSSDEQQRQHHPRRNEPTDTHEPRTSDIQPDAVADDLVVDDYDGLVVDGVSSGTQTPAPKAADNDELERFRSEWRREVQSRAQPTPSRPPAAADTGVSPRSAPRSAGQEKPTSAAQPDEPADTPSQGIPDDGPGMSAEEELLANSIPIPEAEIYGPAALKYSKGAHRIPHTRQPPETPSAPVDSRSVDGETTAAPSTGKARSTQRSRFRDEIASSAIPFSTSSGPSRPLKAKATITGGRIIEHDTAAGPSAQAYGVLSRPQQQVNETSQSTIRPAVEAYARAVEMERSGQLDEALVSYRRAFKLNSNADRLYHRAQLLLSDPDVAPQQSDALLSTPDVAEKVRRALDIDDHRFVAIQERKAREAQAVERGETAVEREDEPSLSTKTSTVASAAQSASRESAPDQLTKLFSKLSIEGGGERDFSQVDFVPEDEEKEVILSRLPDELVLHILWMVIAPRGRRGAKIAKPKPPPTTDELAAQSGRAGGASVRGDKQGKPSDGASGSTGVATAAQPATHASIGAPTTTTTTSATGETTEALADKPAAPTRRHLGIGIVLGGADWQALELIGRTCWKLRLLTRSPSLWKEIVRETYYPPLLDVVSTPLVQLYEKHHRDWRTVFVNQPRVRLNGCYIAACHYARPGMSEESVWIRVVHVVEFYRSIRFLPDGRCLSLLTTEPPSETVRKLEPSLKAKGFAVGRWELFPQGLEDDEWEKRPRGPKVTVEDLRDPTMQKYAFRMVFALRQTARGKWNKLELLEYFSVNLSNGEILPLPQKHSKPFHFSRVIPYGV